MHVEQRQTALVTGGTGLIGSAICRALLAQDLDVLVGSRLQAKADVWIKEHCPRDSHISPLEIDLASEDGINRALDSLEVIPTVLVANASDRENLDTPLRDLTHESFQRLINVDVAGHFLLAQKLAKRLPDKTRASIVMMSSVYATCGVDERVYPDDMSSTPIQYVAAKSSMLGLTRHLAAQWGPRGIRVNAVISGGVENGQPPEFIQRYADKTMLKRMATADEIASAVVFLATGASSYITGAHMVVDGGFTAW